jgi:hypothetical protein
MLGDGGGSNGRCDDVSLLLKFFNGFSLLALKICLNVFWLSRGVINGCGWAPGRLTVPFIASATVLLGSILSKRIELLPAPSSVDW